MKRMRAAATVANPVCAAILILVCCCLGGSSAWAIDCLSAPGDPKTGWYSWREIDGRKCWFLKAGAMPAKSQLHWPAKAGQDARSIAPVSPADERTEPVAEAPPPADTTNRSEPSPPTSLRFKTARVKPATAPSLHLGHGLDLMNGASLTANTPPSLAPADPFHARFTGRKD
jgi:hypothetical protein